jgi:hypothetical protein
MVFDRSGQARRAEGLRDESVSTDVSTILKHYDHYQAGGLSCRM